MSASVSLHELRGARARGPRVVHAEPAARVDEVDREARSNLARELERDARGREVRRRREELRADVRRDARERHVLRGGDRAERGGEIRARDAELRLVVPRRDVRVRADLVEIEPRVDADRDADRSPHGARARVDARDLLDALRLDGSNAAFPRGDREIELFVALGDAAVDDRLRR